MITDVLIGLRRDRRPDLAERLSPATSMGPPCGGRVVPYKWRTTRLRPYQSYVADEAQGWLQRRGTRGSGCRLGLLPPASACPLSSSGGSRCVPGSPFTGESGTGKCWHRRWVPWCGTPGSRRGATAEHRFPMGDVRRRPKFDISIYLMPSSPGVDGLMLKSPKAVGVGSDRFRGGNLLESRTATSRRYERSPAQATLTLSRSLACSQRGAVVASSKERGIRHPTGG